MKLARPRPRKRQGGGSRLSRSGKSIPPKAGTVSSFPCSPCMSPRSHSTPRDQPPRKIGQTNNPHVKSAFKEVARGWLLLAEQMEWMDRQEEAKGATPPEPRNLSWRPGVPPRGALITRHNFGMPEIAILIVGFALGNGVRERISRRRRREERRDFPRHVNSPFRPSDPFFEVGATLQCRKLQSL